MFERFLKCRIRTSLLIIFFALAVLPLAISIAQNYFFLKDALINSAIVRLDSLALGHSRLVDEWFKDKLNIIKSFSNDSVFGSGNITEIEELLKNIKKSNPEFGALIFTDLDGKVAAETSGDGNVNYSDRAYFKQALKEQYYISDVLKSRIDGKPCIVFASSVLHGGKVIGVLAGTVALGKLQEITDVSFEGETLESYLAGSAGHYLFPPSSMSKGIENSLVPVQRNYMVDQGLKGLNGTYTFTDGKNNKMIAAYRWVPTARAVLIIEQEESEAVSAAKGWGLRNSILITVILVLLLIPSVLWLTRTIAGPLELISHTLREIATGNFDSKIDVPNVNQEIRVVMSDINTMAKWLADFQKNNAEQMAALAGFKAQLERQNNELTVKQQQLLASNTKLEDLANTDQLTGIYNRRFFTRCLRQKIEFALMSDQDLCLVLLDIDHFKRINDTYGHKVGDQVLAQLAHVVKMTIRDSDIIARFGGEEFVFLAPNTRLEGGAIMAEKVRTAIENKVFDTDAGGIKVTVSLGVSNLRDYCFNVDINQVEDCLLKVADDNLYTAKSTGRNRVVS